MEKKLMGLGWRYLINNYNDACSVYVKQWNKWSDEGKRNDTSTYEKLVHKYNMMELCYNSANEANVFMLQKSLKKQSCHILGLSN